jgi:putative transposase
MLTRKRKLLWRAVRKVKVNPRAQSGVTVPQDMRCQRLQMYGIRMLLYSYPVSDPNHVVFYRRNLPHWQPDGSPIFLTWRLSGSLPRGTVTSDCAPSDSESPGERFARLDKQLDRCATGPKWLRVPIIAASLVDAIKRGAYELNQYQLHGYVVMPNHVHLLITPVVSVTKIMRGMKGSSAHRANKVLGRTGKAFWQDESFDHWVRNEREFGNIHRYILNNPMTAGLVRKAEGWPWSSAVRMVLKATQKHSQD